MKMKSSIKKTFPQKSIITALLLLGTASVDQAQAAVVNAGDVLTINPAVTGGAYGFVTSGSYFSMNLNNNGSDNTGERTALYQGTTGLVIGTTMPPGAHHQGFPTASDTGPIDKSWSFGGNTGSDYLTVAVSGSTTAGLNFSGWAWAWSELSPISLGSGAWTPANCNDIPGCSGTFQNGVAKFSWDGIYGHAYSLSYAATTPGGCPCGISSVRYFLHLEGTVNAVPIPAAAWLFGSGLLGLLGIRRRR